MSQETTGPSVTTAAAAGDESPERRRAQRAQVELAITLSRHTGGPINGRTVDVAVGGMRVATTRPLKTDELLDFAMPVESEIALVQGRARVMREHTHMVYGLRIEHIGPDAKSRLSELVHIRL